MVTVEMAISLTALVLVFGLLLAGLGAMRLQSQVCQGAREVARETAVSGVENISGGDFSVSTAGRWVTVSGSAPLTRIFGLEVGAVTCSVKTLSEEALVR